MRAWRGPEFDGDFPSLGWALLPVLEESLRAPSGKLAGEPFRLDGWQLSTFIRFYAVDPDTGRFTYRRLVIEEAKGKGKSPFAAALNFIELVGDVVFDGWDAAGEPVGRPRAVTLQHIAAPSEEATENCYGALRAMLAGSPALDEFGIDLGLTRIYRRDKHGSVVGEIQPVSSAAPSREGAPITFGTMEETQYWTKRSGGVKLAETIRRNLTKMGGRSVEVSNAPEPGLGSVAELSGKAAAGARGVLYVNSQAPPVKDPKDRAELLPALTVVYADAPWVDVDRVVDDSMDDDLTPAQVRRFFLNQRVASESRLVDSALLDQRVVVDELVDGDPVAVGFDGSLSRDATAVVLVHMVTGRAFLAGVWERPPFADRGWEVPRDQVQDLLRRVFGRFRVARMKADPSWWREELAGWQQTYGRDVVDRFPVSQSLVVSQAVEAVQSSFRGGQLTVDGSAGSARLVEHLGAATTVTDAAGRLALVKPDDGRRIDCAAALVYAWQARLEAMSKGWTDKVPAPAEPFVVMS